MSLVNAALQARLFEHEVELRTVAPRVCLCCHGMIDAHHGVGRKPETCGRVKCKRFHTNAMRWRNRNKKSRAEMVARLKEGRG